MMFAPADAPEHTQWTWSRDPQGPEVQRFAASQAPLPGDSAVAQAEEATLLAKLIDLTGPAVVVTHSAGAPSGWLAAQERPGQVLAVVAVEPMGPPFVNMPGFGELTWGLSTARMVSEPASETPDELQQHPDRALPGLTGTPVLVVTASASPAAPNGHLVAQFLSEHGAQVTDLALADEGITGNAHGLMAEANSAESVQPVIAWLNRTVNT
jgi:pimeloyl-ACP methyl ester carboxylesterase